jgi:hypothetical protein
MMRLILWPLNYFDCVIFIDHTGEAPCGYTNHAGQTLRDYIDYSQPDAARLHRLCPPHDLLPHRLRHTWCKS